MIQCKLKYNYHLISTHRLLYFHFSYEELCSCWSADPNSRPSASSLVDYFQVQKDHKELPGSLVSIVSISMLHNLSSGVPYRVNKVTATKPNKQCTVCLTHLFVFGMTFPSHFLIVNNFIHLKRNKL